MGKKWFILFASQNHTNDVFSNVHDTCVFRVCKRKVYFLNLCSLFWDFANSSSARSLYIFIQRTKTLFFFTVFDREMSYTVTQVLHLVTSLFLYSWITLLPCGDFNWSFQM